MAGAANIGMSVPGASSLMPSPADQVAGETELERKKRLQNMQASMTQPGASALMGSGYGNALPASG
jgi:hypothetical protein